VAIGENTDKESFFPLDKRLEWINQVFKDNPQIEVTKYEGLTVDFCKANDANFILRGLRTSADFEFERSIGQVNKKLNPGIETVFLLTRHEFTSVNSSIVREIIKYGGDPTQFVPDSIDIA